MAARETLQARQAALLVHGLAPAARQRVVAQLDAAELARLQPLLDELAALGISPALGHELRYLMASGANDSSAHTQVARLDADAVSQALDECAPATAAYLLRAADWPWKSQVLDRMPDARRMRVLESMQRNSVPLAPAALNALCEQLCQQAGQVLRAPGSAGAPTGNITIRLGRWLGWTR